MALTIATFAMIFAGALTRAADSGDAHQHHQPQTGIPEMDADGRRLDSENAQHDVDDEMLARLREKIALYRALTDVEARMNMALMGPNYEWYVSDTSMTGDVGVLILSHGVGENSDRMFTEALAPVAESWPTAVSFGMAMMMSSQLQSSVDDLVARGAKTIVLVPTAVTEHNSLTRQWQYIFEMYDDYSYLDVPQVETDARIIMAAHFDDHPLITEILLDHAAEVSTNPENEVVIIVAHGPEDMEDNELDLAITQAHVDRFKAETNYSDVKIINIQDDAYPPIRASNVKKLRRWINSAQRAEKEVIVLVCSSASHGFQAHVRQDLRGLDYSFAAKGLSEHPNYVKWIQTTIEERLAEEEQLAGN
jgi:hypothetical protein